MKTYFDHEKLDVYQRSIAFCGWVGELLSDITGKAAAKDQLDRASTSLPLNIAEGVPAKEQLVRIVNMLMGMLKRFSGRAEFLREDEGTYPDNYDYDHEQEHDHEQK